MLLLLFVYKKGHIFEKEKTWQEDQQPSWQKHSCKEIQRTVWGSMKSEFTMPLMHSLCLDPCNWVIWHTNVIVNSFFKSKRTYSDAILPLPYYCLSIDMGSPSQKLMLSGGPWHGKFGNPWSMWPKKQNQIAIQEVCHKWWPFYHIRRLYQIWLSKSRITGLIYSKMQKYRRKH